MKAKKNWIRVSFILALFFFNILNFANAQEIIDQEQTQQNTINNLVYFNLGQTFTSGLTAKLTKIEFLIGCDSNKGCGGENITVKLFNVDANNKPTGNSIASTVINSFNELGPVWKVATFKKGPMLISGTKYAFILTKTNNEYVAFLQDSNIYNNGIHLSSNNNTSTWHEIIKQDMAFKVYVKNTLETKDRIANFIDISISNNPAKSQANLYSDYSGTIKLINTTGQIIKIIKVEAKSTTKIDLSSLPNGVYTIQGIIENRQFLQKLNISK